jgi:hypothetical protein
LISAIGLIYIAFFHSTGESTEENEGPQGEPQTASTGYTLNDFLFLFIIAEFMFFSYTIVTRIATILGIHVFRSGRLPGSPLDRKDNEGGSALEIQGQLEGNHIDDDEAIDFDDQLQSEDRYN